MCVCSYAASRGSIETVQLLLDARANVSALDRFWMRPIDIARLETHPTALISLLQAEDEH